MVTAPTAPTSVILGRTEVRDGDVSALVLRCGGEIDSSTAHQLTTAVGHALTHAAPDQVLVVDLREVEFLGASAVTALVSSTGRAPAGRIGPRLVVGTNRRVLLVVDALELDATFSIHLDVPDALHGRHRPRPGPR